MSTTTYGTVKRLSPAAEQTSTVIEYAGQMGLGTYAMGSSDDAISAMAYASSPIHDTTSTKLDDDMIRNIYVAELSGDRTLNTDFSALYNAQGTATVSLNMDYKSAPLIDDSLTDFNGNAVGSGGGMPMGPRVPNTATPENKSTKPEDQPAKTAPSWMGTGGNNGSVLSPANTSNDSEIVHDDGSVDSLAGIGTTAEALGRSLILGKSPYTVSTG